MNNSARSSISTITTGPIYRSEKHYLDVPYDAAESAPGATLLAGSPTTCTLRVPVRRINLTNGEHCDVYDTSGIYTETQYAPPQKMAATPSSRTSKPA